MRRTGQGGGGPIDLSTILVAVLALVVAGCILPPLWFLVMGSLHRTTETGATGAFTFDYYRRLSRTGASSRVWQYASFAFGSAALAILCGGTVAWLVTRTNVPLKGFAYLTAIVSLGTPFVLYVSAWLFLSTAAAR